MSAYVCTNNRTFSCIIELAMRMETITNPDQLAKRLYLLNVESINQRYQLKETYREEYDSYIANAENVHYEPQPDAHDAQRIKAARCWMYQSCEGDCDRDFLYRAVDRIVALEAIYVAHKIDPNFNGSSLVIDDVLNAISIMRKYEEKNNLENYWE